MLYDTIDADQRVILTGPVERWMWETIDHIGMSSGFRERVTLGTVIDFDEGDHTVKVRWDTNTNGACWHKPDTLDLPPALSTRTWQIGDKCWNPRMVAGRCRDKRGDVSRRDVGTVSSVHEPEPGILHVDVHWENIGRTLWHRPEDLLPWHELKVGMEVFCPTRMSFGIHMTETDLDITDWGKDHKVMTPGTIVKFDQYGDPYVQWKTKTNNGGGVTVYHYQHQLVPLSLVTGTQPQPSGPLHIATLEDLEQLMTPYGDVGWHLGAYSIMSGAEILADFGLYVGGNMHERPQRGPVVLYAIKDTQAITDPAPTNIDVHCQFLVYLGTAPAEQHAWGNLCYIDGNPDGTTTRVDHITPDDLIKTGRDNLTAGYPNPDLRWQKLIAVGEYLKANGYT
jgi:hypothetical protein